MIGANYVSRAVQAVLGAGHSPVIPDVLWGAWLDDTLDVIAMVGLTVSHDVFEESGDGVANAVTIDAGLCPATVPDFFALMDAEESGDIVAYAAVTFDETPAEDDPLTFAPGSLVFTYEAP